MKKEIKEVKVRGGAHIMHIDYYNKAYKEILNVLDVRLWLFLVKHNALKRYLDNCIVFRVYFSKIMKLNTFLYTRINTAFIWLYTREGSNYWSNLSKKYLYERDKNLSRVC